MAFKVSDKTAKLLKELMLREYKEELELGLIDEEEYREECREIEEMFNEAGNDAMKLVQIFIDKGWDKPAFEYLVDDPRIPTEDQVILFGIAEVKIHEWPT